MPKHGCGHCGNEGSTLDAVKALPITLHPAYSCEKWKEANRLVCVLLRFSSFPCLRPTPHTEIDVSWDSNIFTRACSPPQTPPKCGLDDFATIFMVQQHVPLAFHHVLWRASLRFCILLQSIHCHLVCFEHIIWHQKRTIKQKNLKVDV